MIKGHRTGGADAEVLVGGVEIRMHGVRQDVPPWMERIDYEIVSTRTSPTGVWSRCTTT
jgi:hypothetical protein